MRLRIHHETELRFPAGTRATHVHLRLAPRSFEAQYVMRWRVETDLHATLRAREDAYGSIVNALSWHKPLEKLLITASGEVETTDRAGVVQGAVETLPDEMYLRASALGQANPALRDFAASLTGDDPLDRMHRLMAELHERLAFSGGFGGEAPASEVFALAKGGAADFAHVFVAVARELGMPARFVTGYRLEEEAQEGADMFAWAEVLTPGFGWIGFDAVHDLCANERYVRVAAGLDARDAPPVRVWTQAGETSATVKLRVEQAGAQTQN